LTGLLTFNIAIGVQVGDVMAVKDGFHVETELFSM
jgi:hypothetical protein